MGKKDDKDVKFEEALSRLESLVTRLESGELSLDESLGAFEEGVKLSTLCNSRLDEAERKVETLLADGRRAPLDAAPGAGGSEADVPF